MTENAASINTESPDVEPVTAEEGEHLREVPTGAGCTEIWEQLSEQRENNDDADTDGGERGDGDRGNAVTDLDD
ncbi:hypothetical protein ACERIT_03080 [Halopenitus sp. H-Gu1]|uniref:hypothetical protein n=1 Tax=Halopenitus sp. H-Gu1 TaxID=3242697 RepID=UPI00359D5D3D